MPLWLAHRAWNLFCDPRGDCLRWRGAFLSCDFGLPRTGSSSAVQSGSLDSFYSSSSTSSSLAWALGLISNGPESLDPLAPQKYFIKVFCVLHGLLTNLLLKENANLLIIYKYIYYKREKEKWLLVIIRKRSVKIVKKKKKYAGCIVIRIELGHEFQLAQLVKFLMIV